jgi:UDP-N-acetylglucosamine--N-acetylmuramyl-(pentapeptide) pyrophosphoryl-undecaprenol N-acetylglucosamine transferase
MVLVPFPHAADNHQQANADSFRRHGAATVVEQVSAAATGDALWRSIEPLLSDTALRDRMGAATRALARPEAAERVLALLDDAVRAAA